MAKNIPTQDQLRDRFEYRQDGSFVWKKNINPRLVGKAAGSLDSRGYMRVTIGGKNHQTHRLMWIFWNGEIPDGMEIDHINGIRHDNRISNLRLADRSANMCNLQGAHSDSKTGLLGVTKHKCGRYQAQFDSKYLGLYATPEEAHEAYLEYKKEIT